jgi:hypothetical protein
MKYILALGLVSLMFVGMAAAQDLNDFIDVAAWNLIHATPGFAAGYAEVNANADWVGDEGLGKLAPYTVAQIVFSDPTGATNTWVDPTATLNMTSVAVAGLGVGDVVTGDIKNQEWQSYAAAAGAASTDVSAIHNAFTVAAFDVDATVDPFSSESTVTGGAFSIADHVHFPPVP